jgi:uncharacterized membrane protein HdeD (DUF308 family)
MVAAYEEQINIIRITQEMIHKWEWFLGFGITLTVLGIAAIVRSAAAKVTSLRFFGWLMILASIIDLVSAFTVGKWAGFFLHLLLAIFFGVTGVIFLRSPAISAEVATLATSIFFLIAGLYQVVVALWTHLPGFGWQVANGIITFILGGLLLVQWPVSGLFAIGLFLGIALFSYGWTWIALALGLGEM